MEDNRSGERRYELKILVADPDHRRRAALARPLALEGLIVSEAASAGEVAARLAEMTPATTFDALIVDVELAGEREDMVLIVESLRRSTAAPILLTCSRRSFDVALAGMRAGATTLVTHPVRLSRLLVGLATAFAEQAHTRVTPRRPSTSVLSPRQRMVAELLVDGHTNKEIGRALGITERTVEAHRREIMARMRVKTFADFVRVFLNLEKAT
jgi:two-component system response regulator FixJ